MYPKFISQSKKFSNHQFYFQKRKSTRHELIHKKQTPALSSYQYKIYVQFFFYIFLKKNIVFQKTTFFETQRTVYNSSSLAYSIFIEISAYIRFKKYALKMIKKRLLYNIIQFCKENPIEWKRNDVRFCKWKNAFNQLL